MKPSKTQNYLIAVVVSLIVVCLALVVLANRTNKDSEDGGEKEARLSESDYRVRSFASAAEHLEIEPVEEWLRYTGGGFSLAMPECLQPLTEAEQQSMLSTYNTGGANVLLIANDRFASVTGINVTVNTIATEDNMTPDTYVSGVANEMRRGGYSIEDRSAYELGGARVGRLIYSQAAGAHSWTGVQFAFSRGTTLWVVVGTGMNPHFDYWLPIFEAIAATLVIG